MPAEANTTATRPARTRAARPAAKPAAASTKAAPAKAAPAAKTPAEKVDVTRFTVALEHVGTTKSFEKFAFPDSYKGVVVGNVYAPPGTVEVKVLVIGDGDAGDAPE